MCEQTCADCRGVGYQLVGFTGTMPRFGDSLCPTCDGTGTIQRTGPYRLADGTWSDGVDRTHHVNRLQFNRANPSRWTVSKCDDEWEVFQNDAGHEYSPDPFPTHAEAITHADRMARGGA